jgi:hypothetical protein
MCAGAKQTAEKLKTRGFVTGHDFSRAANAQNKGWALV